MVKIIDRFMKWLTIIILLWRLFPYFDDYKIRLHYFREIDTYLTLLHLGYNGNILYLSDNPDSIGDDFINFNGRLTTGFDPISYDIDIAVNTEFQDTIHLFSYTDDILDTHSSRYNFKVHYRSFNCNFDTIMNSKPGKWFVFEISYRFDDGFYGFVGSYKYPIEKNVKREYIWSEMIMESKRTNQMEGWNNLFYAIRNKSLWDV